MLYTDRVPETSSHPPQALHTGVSSVARFEWQKPNKQAPLRNRGGKGSNVLVEEHQVTTTRESTMNSLIWDYNKSFRIWTISFQCLNSALHNRTPAPYQHFTMECTNIYCHHLRWTSPGASAGDDGGLSQ